LRYRPFTSYHAPYWPLVGDLKMKTLSTALQIKNAKAGVYSVKGASGLRFKKISDEPGGGSYVVRFRLGDRRPTMGLGAFSEISLAGAREAATEAVKLARKGIDPIEARRREKAANLAAEQPLDFKQATEAYFEAHAPSWKHKYARAVWLNPIVKYAYPVIGRLGLDAIGVEHVAAIVRAAANANAPEAGRRVRARIEAVLDAAVAKGQLDAMRRNPADAKLVAKVHPLRRRKGARPHFRRIEKIDDAPAAFRALRQARERAQTGPAGAAIDAWLFMIATCARPSEAREARWSEIDFDRRLWTLPAERTKTGCEHVAPLNSIALETLERRRKARTGDAVFGSRSGSPVSNSVFTRVPKKTGIDAGAPHSWRSIFRDFCGDVARVDRDLAEAALAHSLGATEGAYRRDTAVEARRPVMAAYAKWLCGDAGADVIAFPTRA
jgi:integrase